MGLELAPRAKISVTSDEMTSAAGQAGQVSRPYCLAVQCFRRSGEPPECSNRPFSLGDQGCAVLLLRNHVLFLLLLSISNLPAEPQVSSTLPTKLLRTPILPISHPSPSPLPGILSRSRPFRLHFSFSL